MSEVSVKRYDQVWEWIEERKDGEFVKYSDHLAAMEALRTQPRAPTVTREEAIAEYRMDELDAVMYFVDKWFDKSDPRLKDNPATRASSAREIALKAIEAQPQAPVVDVPREEIARLVELSGDENWTDGQLTDAIHALLQSKGGTLQGTVLDFGYFIHFANPLVSTNTLGCIGVQSLAAMNRWVQVRIPGGLVMTYTIEDVKRLVPEASEFNQAFYGPEFKIDGTWYDCSVGGGKALLTTRAQLAIARAALEKIDKVYEGSREADIAWKALDTITKDDQ